MHTNTMMTAMMQTMIMPPTIPATTGTTEDGGEDEAVGFSQEKMQVEIHRYISILVYYSMYHCVYSHDESICCYIMNVRNYKYY